MHFRAKNTLKSNHSQTPSNKNSKSCEKTIVRVHCRPIHSLLWTCTMDFLISEDLV